MCASSLLQAESLKIKNSHSQHGSALIDALIATVIAALVFVSTATTLSLASRNILRAQHAEIELREIRNLAARIQVGAISIDETEYNGWSISTERFNAGSISDMNDEPINLLSVTIANEGETEESITFLMKHNSANSDDNRFKG